MEEKLEIFFVRHADTTGAGCGDRDVCDIDISKQGEKQLELLAERFRGVRFDAVLSSPLVRTVKTAAAVAGVLEGTPQIELMTELVEKGSTEGYEGLSIEYLTQIYPYIVRCSDNVYGGSRKDETKAEAMERARALVAYLKDRFTFGQKIILFSHACFGNSFLPSAVSIREEEFRFTLFNTSVSKIKYTPDGVERISFINDCSHLISLKPDFQFEI